LLDNGLLFLLPSLVLFVQLLRELLRLLRVPLIAHEQQACGEIGAAQASCGVDSRREHEGDVKAVDRATGQARGFAFVEMSYADGARKAISDLDRHQYGGRSLTVNEAKPMAPRGGGFGAGGGGRQRRESRW
jgi:hypothetical protein